jgi:hypothetical protein
MTTTETTHRIRWYVYAGGYGQPLQRIPHAANMRGHWPGWDVECSCGWESSTGGATKGYVSQLVWGHKWDHKLHKFQQED